MKTSSADKDPLAIPASWKATAFVLFVLGVVVLPFVLEGWTVYRLAQVGALAMAVLVSAIHTAAMIAAGGVLAWAVYRYLGLTFISKSWFNLDVVWAASLIGVGVISLAAVS